MHEQDDEARITYSVRELLDKLGTQLTDGFARLERGLENKADKADLADIKGELRGHGVRIERLEKARETETAGKRAVVDLRERGTKFWLAVAVVVATLVSNGIGHLIEGVFR